MRIAKNFQREYTGIDTLIRIDGYYYREDSVSILSSFIFSDNRKFLISPGSSNHKNHILRQEILKERLEDGRMCKGNYTLSGDTINVKWVIPYALGYYRIFSEKYLIINDTTLRQIWLYSTPFNDRKCDTVTNDIYHFYEYQFDKPNYSPIPETTKRLDIPKYNTKSQFDGYPFVYWHFSKQKEQQLGLECAELSSDSLIFRVWITNPVGSRGQPHSLIEIKHDSSKWTASLYAMHVNFNANNISEKIVNFAKKEITPKKNDWNFIIDSLYQLKFDILPTDEIIPNYYKDNSGYKNNLPTFSFEYTTKNQYRFYQYNYPERKSHEFWQAENVLKILKLLDDEFTCNDLIKNSLDSLSKDVNYLKQQCKGIFYGFRIDAGAFIPLDNLKNTLGISPHFGLFFGFPFTDKYRFDLGGSFFIPVNSNKLEYLLPDTTLSGKASISGSIGFWVSRIDLLKKCWVIDSRFGTGISIFTTNIPKNKPKYDNDNWYSAETIFLSLGLGVRKGSIGLSFNYFFVPYNAFKKNFKADFGSQYLTISTYFIL